MKVDIWFIIISWCYWTAGQAPAGGAKAIRGEETGESAGVYSLLH